MNRTRLLMIGALAVALGLLASVYVWKSLNARSGAGNEPGYQVIVAADDLQVGTKIGERDIKIIRVSQSDLPAGAPRAKSEVLGHGVILPITKGDFILKTKIAGENESGLPSLIPPGMRAVSVRVNEVVSVAGFVTPGTRVDVLLTGTPGAGGDQQTTTVLQNVQVIASGHTLERTSTGEAQNTAVITLLVSPDDAERLTLASSQGHIQLALRNPLDTRQEEVAAANSRGLYHIAAAPAPPKPVVHHAAPVKATPPPDTSVSVEVIPGDKKAEVVKFPDEKPEVQ
jgi:pilus assembly protein CpaB